MPQTARKKNKKPLALPHLVGYCWPVMTNTTNTTNNPQNPMNTSAAAYYTAHNKLTGLFFDGQAFNAESRGEAVNIAADALPVFRATWDNHDGNLVLEPVTNGPTIAQVREAETAAHLHRIEQTITAAGYYYAGNKRKIRRTKTGCYYVSRGRHSLGVWPTLAAAVDRALDF
jgi:hypothetical protein